jgi:hypothetical protein
MSEKINIDDAINEYYKLKSKYETAYYDTYIKPIVKAKAKDKSKREKRIEYSKLPKAECVNCKRNVGSVFSITEKSFARTFIAKCGDINDPCPLNINILASKFVTYEDEIKSQEKDINKLKTDIIKEKYNIMFGYTEEETGIDNFTGFSNELKDTTMLAGMVIEKNILINDNPEKHELLKKSEDVFGNDYILQFKQMVKQYNDTADTQVLNEAVKFYVNEMVPRLKEIQELKYEENFVEYEADNGEYKLYQRKNSMRNLEYALESDSKVISFVTGLKQVSKSQTLKASSKASKGNKTRKRQLSFVIEGDEPNTPSPEYNPASPDYNPASPEYNPASPEYNPASPEYNPASPEYNPADEQAYNIQGSLVTWKDPIYNSVWVGLSGKYRDILIRDPTWMEETVQAFVDLKSTPGARREFILPSDIVLPPTVSEGKQLEFGNDTLNDLIEHLSTVQKGILINAIPRNKEPSVSDLRPFVSMLKSMLAQAVDFRAY